MCVQGHLEKKWQMSFKLINARVDIVLPHYYRLSRHVSISKNDWFPKVNDLDLLFPPCVELLSLCSHHCVIQMKTSLGIEVNHFILTKENPLKLMKVFWVLPQGFKEETTVLSSQDLLSQWIGVPTTVLCM